MSFFARVTRRVHAPLALVGKPLRVVRRVGVRSTGLTGGLGIVTGGAGQLLGLTSRLLSFRGVKTGGVTLGLRAIGISRLLRRAIGHFRPACALRRGRLRVRRVRLGMVTGVSGRTVAGVLDGLLGGKLGCNRRLVAMGLSGDRDFFDMDIDDSNRGVTGRETRRVFRPFFRDIRGECRGRKINVKLALTHSLTLLRGKDLVLSAARPGGAFMLAVPLGLDRRRTGLSRPVVRAGLPLGRAASSRRCAGKAAVLLIRSRDGVLTFVGRELRRSFVMRATLGNGVTLSVLRGRRISVIVDSIVVPRVSNCRLYGRVGSSVGLDRVPVVFLATGGSVRDGVGKLRVKTRTCVRGPFSFSFLRTRVHSLLRGHRGRHGTFSGHPFFPVRGVRVDGRSRRFVRGMLSAVGIGLESRAFGMRHVTSRLYVDHSDLLHGVGALFGVSPVSFVHLVHLGHSTRLVRRKGCHIKRVYCVIKFDSRSCFDGLFFGRFNVAPGSFRGRITDAHGGVQGSSSVGVISLVRKGGRGP